MKYYDRNYLPSAVFFLYIGSSGEILRGSPYRRPCSQTFKQTVWWYRPNFLFQTLFLYRKKTLRIYFIYSLNYEMKKKKPSFMCKEDTIVIRTYIYICMYSFWKKKSFSLFFYFGSKFSYSLFSWRSTKTAHEPSQLSET